MLDDFELHESYNEEERNYLNKKIDDLSDKTLELENGCLRHYKGTEEKPYKTVNLFSKSIFGRDRFTLECHRFIAFCIYGRISSEQIVRHKCRTKACYNPDHIELGTRKENEADKMRDGTRGNKLTEEDVLEIFSNRDIYTNEEMADYYGVSIETIISILNGINWSHITGLKSKKKTPTKEESQEKILNDKEKYFDKIMLNVKVNIKTKCWNWKGCISDGYGSIKIYYSTFRVHIVMWSIKNGKFPLKEEVVRHLCPKLNRACCNPDHLEIGSFSDNMKDRKLFGENTSNSKLTNEDVLNIMNDLKKGLKFSHIAKKYNVDSSAISNIKYGKTWRYITGYKLDDSDKSRTLSDRLVSNIKAIILLNKYENKNIAFCSGCSYNVVRDISKNISYKDIEPKLDEYGINIIKQIENKIREEKELMYNIPKNDLCGKKKLSSNDIADIKYILNLDKFTHEQIALYYKTKTYVVGSIFRGNTYINIEKASILSSKSSEILKKLEAGIFLKENNIKSATRNSLNNVGVSDIKYLLILEEFSQKEIANEFNTSGSTVSLINNDKYSINIYSGELSNNGRKILESLRGNKLKYKEKIKLTNVDISDIRILLSEKNFTGVQIAKEYNVSSDIIIAIKNGRKYKKNKTEKELSDKGNSMLKQLQKYLI